MWRPNEAVSGGGADGDRRLVADGEVHRAGDEALLARLLVQLHRLLGHGGVGDGYPRPEHDLGEVAAVVVRSLP